MLVRARLQGGERRRHRGAIGQHHHQRSGRQPHQPRHCVLSLDRKVAQAVEFGQQQVVGGEPQPVCRLAATTGQRNFGRDDEALIKHFDQSPSARLVAIDEQDAGGVIQAEAGSGHGDKSLGTWLC